MNDKVEKNKINIDRFINRVLGEWLDNAQYSYG